MTDYYDPTGAPAQASSGSSSTMRAEFLAIQSGISNKLPPLTGNGSEFVRIKSDTTGLESVTLAALIGLLGAFTVDDALSSSVTNSLTLGHTTSGTPATGIGTGLAFMAETSAGNNEVGMVIEAVTTDVTSTSEDFDFVLKLMSGGAAAAEVVRVAADGSVTLQGSLTASSGGSLTGTWTNLGTVTTIDINGGTIDGAVIGGSTPAAVTTSSLVATTADINAGTIDNTVIGGTTPAAATFASITLASGATVTAILDEDNMASDSATALATQQSIKAYVDAQVAAGYVTVSGTPIAGYYARFTDADTVEGRTTAQVLSDIGAQASSARLTDIAALAVTDGYFMVANGSTWTAEAPATAIASLGITATATELNYCDITTLGQSEASKAVTADANGDVTFNEEVKAKSYNETKVAVTSSSGTLTLNCEAGQVFEHTMTESTVLAFSNPPASGTAYSCTLILHQDAGGSGFTFNQSVAKDPAGTEPGNSAGANDVDIFSYLTVDGGTTWYCFPGGMDFS